MWSTFVISLVALVTAIPEALLDDECASEECSLEMLHLRARKISESHTGSGEDLHKDGAVKEEDRGVCIKYVNCHRGFFNGIRCNGDRYCTQWQDSGKVCRKYVSCRNGFFNGIDCHGTRYCVSWGLLQEGEKESAEDAETHTQKEEAGSSNTELNAEADNDAQNEEEDGKKCTKWKTCTNGFYYGKKCSKGKYCTKWGGGGNPYGGGGYPYGGNPYGGYPYGGNPYGGYPYGGNPYGGYPYGGGGGKACRKYKTCHNGFFNGKKCHKNKYCVSWLQEGEEESAQDAQTQDEEADSGNAELNAEAESASDAQNEVDDGRRCTSWAKCTNGFFRGVRCSGGRYCTRWGGSRGRVCKKYVSCRNGFFNGINCHGSKHCVTWGLLQEGEEESAQDAQTQDEEADSGNTELNAEAQSASDAQNEVDDGRRCTSWAKCTNGFFRGVRCSGGRYCTRWGGSRGRVCKKYVSCRNGFFNGINCHGSKHCVTWGLLQEGEEESAQDAQTQDEEADSGNTELNAEAQSASDAQNEVDDGRRCTSWAKCTNGFFRGVRCSGGRYCTRWGGSRGRVCKKYVSCRNGFFNGINCHGSKHCVTWGLLQEGGEESAQDAQTQDEEADSSNTELNAEADNDAQNEEEDGKKCTKWETCFNGFFYGKKCSKGKYCTKWGGGGGGGGKACRKYKTCHNGFFNGKKCHKNKYCVSWLQEGEEESAQDAQTQDEEADSGNTELNAEAESASDAQNEVDDGRRCTSWAKCTNGFFRGVRCSGGRYCTRWGGSGRVCKKYVSCRNGFFNGINCHGSKHCVTWGLLQEGEEESAQDAQTQDEEADSGNTELNAEAQSASDAQNEVDDGRRCTSWAKCTNGFFRGVRCSGGRYCTRWGGSRGRVCKKYVSCRNGFFNGINCHGSKHCVTWR